MSLNNDIIQASYEEMRAVSNNIRRLSGNYSDEVKAIYEIVDNLASSWQGVDNLSYVNQAKSYEKDLHALGDVISDYATFLEEAARITSDTQNDIASAAGKM